MEPAEPVLCEIADGMANIRFNRPERMNALDMTAGQALLDALWRAERDPSVRAVTLTAEGRTFVAGADLSALRADLDRAPEAVSAMIALFHQIVRCIRRMRQPVIVGVNGAAAGGGLGLALACDFVIAADNASFVPAYTRLGATADGGTSWSVAHLVGQRRALEWLMLGEPMNAEAALAAGLINRVVPADRLVREVDALANQLAAGPAFAYAQVKRLVYQAAVVSFDMQLEAERDSFVAAAGTSDFREGVTAFFERRPARFGG